MKSKFSILFLLMALVCLFSCSSPSSTAEKFLGDEINKKSNEYLKLSGFQNKDAVHNKEGVESYQASFEATVECVKDGGSFVKDGFVMGIGFSAEQARNNEIPGKEGFSNNNLTEFDGRPNDQGGYFSPKKGDKFLISGRISISKHEQGWVLEGYSFSPR